jgi:hypothetical protein
MAQGQGESYVRSHAKAPTAGSTQAKSLGRTRFAQAAVLAVAIVSLLAFAATPASASLLRKHEGSFGSFGGESPGALTVDQSSGDVYAVDANQDRVLRFNSAGLPHNFSAGPDAGTNELSGLSFEDFPSFNELAVDSSGGPSDGNLYVTQRGPHEVKVFASSGEPLGALTGTNTPNSSFGEICGVAVDQSNGDVYLADSSGFVWRYSPTGSTVAESNYSGGISVPFAPCQLAAAQGKVYVNAYSEFGPAPLNQFSASEFALGSPPSPSSNQITSQARAVATDPSNGDVYADEGGKITVYGSGGSPKYSFGEGDFGFASAGVAVRGGGDVYVADPSAHEVDAYGAALEPGTRAHFSSFGSFGGESPEALTVDQSSGDVYAVDAYQDRVLRFNSAGLPHNFSAGPNPGTNELTGLSFDDFPSVNELAVDSSGGPSDGNLYVTQRGSGAAKVFASSGQPLGTLTGTETPNTAFGEICGVAVDQSNGDVYLADSSGFVWRYSPTGSMVAESDYSGGIAVPFAPCQLAVAQGKVYVNAYSEFGPGPLNQFSTSEFALGSPPSPSSNQITSQARAVATDPSSGDVYADEGGQITVYSSGGSPKYSFGEGDFGFSSAGVAVRGGGDVYVADPSAHEIDAYGPFSAPSFLVETKAATNVKHVKATLHGHLDPNGGLPITGCEFEWGESVSYGETPIPCAEGESFSSAADVSAELTGLTPGTTYHFRLHVTTTSGGSGEDKSFEAIPPSNVPEASTGKASIASSTSSQLKGTVDPNGNSLTNCHFEYVSDIAFQASGFSDLSSGGSVPCDQAPGSIPADFEDHEVTATATGLDPEQIYRFRLVAENANGPGNGADALVPGPPLVETTGSTYMTTTTARLDSRVSPHGASTDYWFEYVTDAQFQASGFAGAVSTPDTPLAVNEVQEVRTDGAGSQFSLSFEGETTPYLSVGAGGEQVQAALRALPSIGSSNVDVVLTAVNPDHSSFSYTITFVGALTNTDAGQISVSPGPVPPGHLEVKTLLNGGPSSATSFVSAGLTGLQPNTAYRYRVVADNGTPGGPSFGDDATLTTRASDAPLSHGHFPGPPGSDRAWEQVNTPDTGGNPVSSFTAVSTDGNRVDYDLAGGSPGSHTGSFFGSPLFAERTPSGWKTSFDFYPTREQAPGNYWFAGAGGPSDLSQEFALNVDSLSGGTADIWHLSPDAPPQRVASVPHEKSVGTIFLVSDDGSRVIWLLQGSVDPDHPVSPSDADLYDVSSGTPHLVSLLPDGSPPPCGVIESSGSLQHWLSADGTRLFFEVRCPHPSLYVRNLETETTSLIASGIASGESVRFIRSTVDAAFFITRGSLVPEDEGSGRDVYRYDLEDESLECLTCFGGLTTDVEESEVPFRDVGVSEDGSRLYFKSPHRLLPGAAGGGIYRLDVASGNLAYVAPAGGLTFAGSAANFGNAISPDGSVLIFHSDSPALDFLNGPRNGGTAQYYRYDDNDRSLVCVSCPVDGSPPRGAAPLPNIGNKSPLSSDGDDFVFSTPTPLVSADQNTAGPGQSPYVGQDVYEWRDGRLLLVTDGLTSSPADPSLGPKVAGVTPSGHDVFFMQQAQLTPDAIDAYQRLYDARIGGGFAFPPPPPPCPLEACQGTPRGVPEESRPGSADFSGTGNVVSHPARCRKGKVRRSGRCVAKKHKRQRAKKRSQQHRANHNRRASR